MLVNSRNNRQNRIEATILATTIGLIGLGLSLLSPWMLLLLPIALGVFVWWRHQVRRRLRVVSREFPATWEKTLQSKVSFFNALDDTKRDRFRKMMQVFVDEVAITGIRTEVDDETVALVAASAVIPVFGFKDWEYSRLGEVLIYPSAYNEGFQTNVQGGDHPPQNILGMVGTGHLGGVMILSKPDLISGFENPTDRRNVGIHEFAHLVDRADGAIDGLPGSIPQEVAKPWIEWVGNELRNQTDERSHINSYAFTNEAEYFAVLSEYFFESPAVLQQREPELYQMLGKIYQQNTKQLFRGVPRRRKRLGRNSPCPCQSGQKFKRCCGRRTGSRSPRS